MTDSSFFTELRRRHVFRVAIAYAVTAWLLLQLADIVLPTFGAPHWVLKVLIAVFVLFFPIALIVAWAFEMTPEGVRRTASAEVARSAASGHRLGRKFDFATIAVLAAAVGVLAWRQFGARPKPQAAHVAAAATARAPAPAAAPAQGTVIPAESIAVLPFENLSLSKQNAFFAAGMQDLILTKLADIGGLKVIARTSTMQYGSHPENLQKVGEQLGVATLLEGSVQRIGDQVLINVQLIDARTDSHMWAQSYQRTLDNVFGVEGEVAAKIAATLDARLTAPETRQLASAPTTNPAAYTAYLRARALANRGLSSAAAQKQQEAAYREAVAQDPHFALAWAQLASLEFRNYLFFSLKPSVLAAARHALEKAQMLAPDAVATQLALGDYDYYVRLNYRAALAAYQNVLARAPNNLSALRRVALIERSLGRWQAAVTHVRRALALDPLNVGILQEAASTFFALRNFASARALVNRALALSSGNTWAVLIKAWIELDEGRLSAAGTLLAKANVDADTAQPIVWGLVVVHDYAGAVRAARAAVADPSCQSSNFTKANCYMWLGYAEHFAGQSAAARADLHRALTAAQALNAQGSLESDQEGTLGLAWGEALLGNKAAALADGHKMVALFPPSEDADSGPFAEEFLAYVEAWVGERGAAIKLLRHLLSVPYYQPVTIPYLRADPGFDSLRGDPRFQALLKEKPSGAPAPTSAD